MKLLLIEDQPSISNTLYRSLNNSYHVHIAPNAQIALQKIADNSYGVILLDLGLPDMNGLELCKIIRSQGISAPIMVVTGEVRVQSKVDLLDSGANDYITKPFHLSEIEARLRALLRSKPSRALANTLEVGDIILDTATHSVTRAGVPIALRRKEFTFLECLMQNAGQVVSKSLLEALVWDEQPQTMANTIHVQVTNLRKKIDKPFSLPLIHTVHGVGYKLDALNSTWSK